MAISFPFRIDPTGRTAVPDPDALVRELIEQVLFTAPGERVNRPDFGTGLQHLVFAPASDEVAAATQQLVQSALQQWLGDQIVVEGLDVDSGDARLAVTVRYRLRRDRRAGAVRIEREVP